jgi:hypothetical protein
MMNNNIINTINNWLYYIITWHCDKLLTKSSLGRISFDLHKTTINNYRNESQLSIQLRSGHWVGGRACWR